MMSPSARIPAESWILGFDIGGTKTAVLAGRQSEQVIDRLTFASKPERGFTAMWEDLVTTGQTMIDRHGQPGAIGVSIGGPMNFSTGTIYSPPNLPGWDAIPLKRMLEETFGVPAYVEHDAKAGALAEWLFGAGRGFKDVVFLTFGTGLGAGLILDGRLYRGANDSAGFVGHWRIAEDGPYVWGKSGSWEGYSSGAGLAALPHYLYPGCFPAQTSAADVIQRARAGEAQAKAIIERSAKALGQGIALIIDLINPQIIVLGSLAVRAGDLFLPVVEQVVAQEAAPEGRSICQIVPAALGEQIGDMAALCAAFYHAGRREREAR
jgi:glucokinase